MTVTGIPRIKRKYNLCQIDIAIGTASANQNQASNVCKA